MAVVDVVETTKLPNHQVTITLAATTSIGRIIIPVTLVDRARRRTTRRTHAGLRWAPLIRLQPSFDASSGGSDEQRRSSLLRAASADAGGVH